MQRDIPRSMIRHYVGRYHVATPSVEIVRDLYKAFKTPRNIAAGWGDKEVRKKAYRFAIAEHEENRALYRSVMRGGI